MSEPKPFASLSSSLLARKGGAKPAMRPHGFGAGGSDDLGWNDMGADAAPPRRPVSLAGVSINSGAAVPPVVQQQEELARGFESEQHAEEVSHPAPIISPPPAPAAPLVVAPAAAAMPASTPRPGRQANGAHGKAAFTLRLDPERHLRLRLACAVKHRSAQQLVTEALDTLLSNLPEIDDLAAQLPSPRTAKHS